MTDDQPGPVDIIDAGHIRTVVFTQGMFDAPPLLRAAADWLEAHKGFRTVTIVYVEDPHGDALFLSGSGDAA